MKNISHFGWAALAANWRRLLLGFIALFVCTFSASSQTISTIVGNGTGAFTGDGGLAALASINTPQGIAFDAAGNLYFSDYGNYRIRKISASGVITTIAGTGASGYTGDGAAATAATLNLPTGLAIDNSGNIYIADQANHCVRRINTAGIIQTVAGTGTPGSAGDGGAATAAQLHNPYQVTFDNSGNMLIADMGNNKIRKVDGSGTITTIAGTGSSGYSGDGVAATLSNLTSPSGVSVDNLGNIFIAEGLRVRMVNPSGIISTFAGDGTYAYGGDGGPATSAQIAGVYEVMADRLGNVYIADQANNRIRVVNSAGTISTFAGTGGTGFSGDGGPALSAHIDGPWIIAKDANGNFYISDQNNNRIRTISCPTPVISAITGPTIVCPTNTISLSETTGGGTWSSNNPSIATVGSTGIVTGISAGNVVISYAVTSGGCTGYARAVVMVGNPIITTIAGNGTSGYLGDNVAATSTRISTPVHSAMDAAGNLYFTDFVNSRIRKVAAGVITTFAGTGGTGFGSDGVPATSTPINNPTGMCVDAAGNVYFADYHNYRVRKINTAGIISTVAGTGSAGASGDGIAATAAAIQNPWGVAVDAAGNIYFSDRYNHNIRKVNTSGIISTVAGSGVSGYSGDGSAATAARLNQPLDIIFDFAGNLYISDGSNNVIRMVNTAGMISTIAGNGIAGYGGDGGPATASSVEFNDPAGLSLDSAGNLFIGDYGNNRLRKISTSGIITTVAGTGTAGFNGDGIDPLTARLNTLQGVGVYGPGDIYICDANNFRVRKISPVAPAAVPPITGSSNLCQDVTVHFSDATPGGTWSSSNSSVASVNATSGDVTGLSAGIATISYTITNNCGNLVARMPVTVNSVAVGTISGPTVVCPTGTITLTDPTGGGTWSSNNPSIATVGSTGIITGISAGNVVISYAVTSGSCTGYARAVITVGNPIITTIAGTGIAGSAGDGGAATAAQITYATHTAMDAAGNIYFGDYTNARVRKISTGGIISTFAGTGSAGVGADGVAATTSAITGTAGVAVDATGNVYFSDYNGSRLRKVNTSGIVTTIAGTGVAGFTADGLAAAGNQISQAWGVAVDLAGNVYFCDRYNQRIRKIDAVTGLLSTIAGTGATGSSGDGGPATAALLNDPCDLFTDGLGNFYFTEFTDNRVRKIDANGIITLLAGTGAAGFSGDNGPSTAARVNNPIGIAADSAGNVYIGDFGNSRVRRIGTAGIITTLTGTSVGGYNGDGGNPSTAEVFHPYGVAVYGSGDIYICDAGNSRIRKISPMAPTPLSPITGTATLCQNVPILFTDATTGGTWASSNPLIATVGSASGEVTGLAAGTASISYTTNNTCGNMVATLPVTVNAFSAGTISGPSIVCPGNAITLTDATSGGTWSSSNTSVATVGSSGVVTGIAMGNVAISYTISNSCGTTAATQQIVVGNPVITTFAGNGTAGFLGDNGPATSAELRAPHGLFVDPINNVFIADNANGSIREVSSSGIITTVAGTGTPGSGGDGGPATAAQFSQPFTVILDPAGNMYISDAANQRVRKVDVLTGIVTTIAGNGLPGYLGDNVAATTTRLNTPTGLAMDAAGNLYIGDQLNNRVRKVSTAGIITTVAGTGTAGYNGDGIAATAAQLKSPNYLHMDPNGNLIIVDNGNHRIRKVDQYGIISTLAGNGVAGGLGDGGAATAAQLDFPGGIAYDGAGNMYIATDVTEKVRVVNAGSGTITTYAGTGAASYTGDGGSPATATFNTVVDAAFDINGNLLIADQSNNVVRRIAPVTPIAPVTGAATVCQSATTTLSDATIGGTWSSGSPLIASVGSTGIVTGVAAGTALISYTVNAACGTTAATQTVTVNPLPAPPAIITGPTTVCIGTTISLNDVTPGGAWSSASPLVATVGSTGIVTGIAPGTAIISYTMSNSCGNAASTTTVTVTSSTGSVTGLAAICVGATTPLAGAPTGGTWSTSNPLIATVGSSSGIVSGVAAGNVTITYTYSGGCTAPFAMSINPLPGPITGSLNVCAGSSTTLTDGVGGTWVSGATGTATVGSATGIVNGISAGTAVITYTSTLGCSTTGIVTVNGLPSAITPPGPVSLCVAGTTSLGDVTPGGTWSSTSIAVATVGTGGLVTAIGTGVATISYTGANGCAATKQVTVVTTPAALSPASANICVGATSVFTDAVAGGTWSSSASGTASVTGGTVTGVVAGTAIISYSLGTCFVTAPVTVIALPAAITPPGPVSMCVGATASLADATPGGTWSSGATSTASVGTSGIVTGVSSGAANISYTSPAGCSSVKVVTVLTTPAALSPASATVCIGSTTTFSDAVPAGTWTSSAGGTASVSGGIVTGIAVGTATITYATGTCFTTAPVTVTAVPNAGTVSGTPEICIGSTTTYTDAAGGGVWSSTDATVATVGSAGLVTGVGVGTATISYTVTNGCGSVAATQTVTVDNPAVPGTIIGVSMLCAGTFTMMADASPGGVWSVTNSHATISTGGLLTGVSLGLDTVLYTVTNACGVATATHPVNIGPFLSAATISGPSSVCVGATITLTDPAPAGVWSSSNSSASVSGGVVTGLSGGVDTIMYTVTAGCGSAVTQHIISVIPVPTAGTIVGPSNLCIGMVTPYTDAAPGGVWGLSNPVATITPGGVFSPLSVGIDTITYTVSNTCGSASASKPVSIGPAISAGSISGPATVCQGASITLTDAAPGGVWSATNGNATVSGGSVTGVAGGADTIYYTVTGSCGSVAASASVFVIPLPDAGTITGTSVVCLGSTITLSDPAPGGFWSASNTNASVSGGVVTGMALGTDDISYTVSNTCGSSSATSTITISTTPTAGTIIGPSDVCVGASITVIDPVSGGVWGVSNPSASIASGIVSGVVSGLDTIMYTVTTACGSAFTTATVNVDPLPFAGAVTGISNVCAGSTTTLTDLTPGGFWSASNPAATVSGGVVTGVTAGVDTIAYNVVNGCGMASALDAVTINPLPSAGTISAPANVCSGIATTLTDPAAGGVWSVSNIHASITSAGILTGVTSGMDTILYTVSNACGTDIATTTISINSLPNPGIITGASTVCKSMSITLSNTVPGGTWISTNARASVAAGVVTGVAAGADTIEYTVSNTCGNASAIKPITVLQAPVVAAIAGPSSICSESSVTLTDATPSGVWSSSNSSIASITSGGQVAGITPGSVTITYAVTNSCGVHSVTHAMTILPIDQCTGTGVKNVGNSEPELKVYPNPNRGAFTMSFLSDREEQVRVVISNVIGNKIREFTASTNKATEVNLNTAAGIYLLSVFASEGKYVMKVTIE